ncbi:sulfatase-like hydrolase/transferase [Microlunatus sp. GCM10028923]|uniref:sulfatase-like hydrolase/transferase n=1 Tax=Microlunatus sp. GCM10028923 TaxID=3273400 RepID=UPI00361ADC22
MARRPNIVIICTDQHRFDAVSTHPGSAAVTPHLERLAADGAVFDHCYSPSPVCAPARASMLTGQYPSSHGLWANGVTLPADASLVSRELAEAGYRTGLIGKLHLAAAFQGRTEERIEDGFEYRRWAHDPFHGSPDNAYHQWLRDRFPELWQAAVGDVVTPDQEGFVHADTAFDAMPTEAHYSTWVAEEATEFLQADDERPFFLVANLFDPHHPFVAPEEYLARFPAGSVPPPVGGLDELATKPAFQTESSGCSYAGHGPSFTDFDAAGIDEIRRTYQAMVTLADESIGKIIEVLDQDRFKADTLVIFTSDHGELLGDHAMLLKGPMMYDIAVRVPMIMRWPDQVPAGRRVASQVGLHDVARTLRAAAALPEQPADQGIDLVAVADGRAEGRDWSLSQYRDSGYPNTPPVHSTMLRSGSYKIILWHGDPADGRESEGELYDLAADPDELINLWQEPEHLATRARLLQQLVDTSVAVEDRSAPRVAPW